jgi:predicted HTH transcriptional regulator
MMVVRKIELTKRQETIVQIVKDNGPITGENIAEQLNLPGPHLEMARYRKEYIFHLSLDQ